MSFTDLFDFTLRATVIEFTGALLIVGYILTAVVTLIRARNVEYQFLDVSYSCWSICSFVSVVRPNRLADARDVSYESSVRNRLLSPSASVGWVKVPSFKAV
jgi:hypothetical protein